MTVWILTRSSDDGEAESPSSYRSLLNQLHFTGNEKTKMFSYIKAYIIYIYIRMLQLHSLRRSYNTIEVGGEWQIWLQYRVILSPGPSAGYFSLSVPAVRSVSRPPFREHCTRFVVPRPGYGPEFVCMVHI